MTSRPPIRMVTVSATYGAGATVVAPKLARRLGLPFADRLLPVRGYEPPTSGEGVTAQELEGEPRSSLLDSLALLSAGMNLPMPREAADLPQQVRGLVENSLRDLMQGGGAVVLGRAAAVALAGRREAFHVRLDGPEDRRVRRGAAWEGISEDEARDRLRATDSARTRYVKRLYRRDPSDVSLYHLVLDSTVLTVDACVEVLLGAAEAYWDYDDEQLMASIPDIKRAL
jgi:cytidylate kinase